jgi:phage major head subunit gpT-like protein
MANYFNSPIAVLKGIKADFAKRLTRQVENTFSQFYESTDSNSNKEIYSFFDSTPEIKEWLDKIDYSNFKMFEFVINNVDYQWGIPVDRNTIDDSTASGMQASILRHIREGVKKWNDQPLRMLNTLLENGTSGLAFDGSAFFADTRPNIQGTNTIDNIATGSGITLAQIQTDYEAAYVKLMGFKDKNAEPFNINVKPVCLIPSSLVPLFVTLQKSLIITNSAVTASVTNVWANTFDVVVNPYQAITNNDWYMIDANAVMKPFIFQSRKSPIFEMKDENDSPIIKYFSTARRAMGYGMPTSIVFVNNS